MKIQLKINGEWAVLPPDFYLKMMKTSPLFSDQGDFSYPFELPVEPNRHIFGPIADPMGFVRLREFHALPAEIWFEGNQVFVGQTEISGEQTFSQRGKVSFNVVSNNGAFKDMINGLKCRDVKLKDEILLGWRPSRIKWKKQAGIIQADGNFLKPEYTLEDVNKSNSFKEQLNKFFDKGRNLTFDISDETEICLPELLRATFAPNVTEPYPFPYCTVRMCCPQTKDNSTSSESSTGGYGYKLYEADGPNRAPSFFVLYFLDCLFGKNTLDVTYDNTSVLSVEDIRRLAFLNSYPRFVDKKTDRIIDPLSFLEQVEESDSYFYNLSASLSLYVEYSVYKFSGNDGHGVVDSPRYFYEVKDKYPKDNKELNWKQDATISAYDCYANGENFPDTDVANVVSDLTNGFGIIFDYDQQNNFMKLHLVRDIMKSTEEDVPSCIILKEPTITRTDKNGQILSYGEGDDLNFNYAMPKGKYRDGGDDPVSVNGFLNLSSVERNRADAHTYYDETTGYAYRLRVDESTGNEPQFCSVGAYRDYKIGIFKDNQYRNHLVFDEKDNELDTSDTKVYVDRDESNADKIDLKFRPVTVNDVWSWYYNEGPGYEGYPDKKKQPGVDIYEYPKSASDQMLCTFVDCEAFNDSITVDKYDGTKDEDGGFYVSTVPNGTYTGLGSRAEMLKLEKVKSSGDAANTTIRIVATGVVTVVGASTFDIKNDQHPLASANVGYQLGIMRGPGNKSDVEIGYNYDDEGNDTWYNVVNSPTFTADSIDPYGNVFDYNGTEAGIGTEWETKRMTPDEALQHLKTMFPKSNVPFADERARFTQILVHTASALGQLGVRISFVVSTKDKDGATVSQTDAITYIVGLAKQVGASMTALYKADKEAKSIIVYGDSMNAAQYHNAYDSLIKVYASGNPGNAIIKVDPMAGRLSLLLDARKVKEYDNDGNPVYFEITDNTVARRGLVPQLLEDFLYFKAHHVKVTFPVLMSLSAINNLQLLKWNRFGDYVGLIKQVNYELTESGLRNVKVELLVANK